MAVICVSARCRPRPLTGGRHVQEASGQPRSRRQRPQASWRGARWGGGGGGGGTQPRAQPQQQQAEAQEMPDGLPDLQLPKFRPFTPQNHLQRAMTSYRSWHDCGNGQTLLVAPLSGEWVEGAADVLTDSFAESMSAMPYKNYLRRQVVHYLQAHMLLPPKAVVLVALLLPPPAEAEAGEHPQPQQQQQQVGSSWSGSSSDASSSGTLAAETQAGPPSEQQQQQPASAPVPELGDGMAMHPLLSGASDTDATSSGSGSDEEGAASGGEGGPSGARLAGVVELSFSASTRSKYLTLTPPEDRPYLCNMAIHPHHRGRGYGGALLAAAEALVAQLGESEIFLHLRVQDLPAAALYQSAGYEEVACDTFLVRFLALDQRRLMRKRLPRGRQPGPQPAPAA